MKSIQNNELNILQTYHLPSSTSYLDRGRPHGEYFVACTFRVAIHIDQHVNTITIDTIGSLSVTRVLRQVNEMLTLTLNFLTETGVIVGCKSVTEYFNVRPVMKARHALHEM